MESENVKLRRRKYSEVKNDFVYRTQFNKVLYRHMILFHYTSARQNFNNTHSRG